MVILANYLESQLLKNRAFVNQLICSGNVKINNETVMNPEFILSTNDVIKLLDAGEFSGCTITYNYKAAKGVNKSYYPW